MLLANVRQTMLISHWHLRYFALGCQSYIHIYNIFRGYFVKVLVFLTFCVMDHGPRTLRTASLRGLKYQTMSQFTRLYFIRLKKRELWIPKEGSGSLQVGLNSDSLHPRTFESSTNNSIVNLQTNSTDFFVGKKTQLQPQRIRLCLDVCGKAVDAGAKCIVSSSGGNDL